MTEQIKVTWSTTYYDKRGYECVLTLSGDNVSEVLAEARRVLGAMAEQRITPVRTRPVPPVPYRTVGGRQ